MTRSTISGKHRPRELQSAECPDDRHEAGSSRSDGAGSIMTKPERKERLSTAIVALAIIRVGGPIGRAGRALRLRSIGVLPLQQAERRISDDVEIEQYGPALDIFEVELHAALDFLGRIDLAAPAIDLRPAGDAGLDAMAGEIAVDDLVPEAMLEMRVHGCGRGPMIESVPGEHVEELWQLVDRGAADEAADAGDARIAAGYHDLSAFRSLR